MVILKNMSRVSFVFADLIFLCSSFCLDKLCMDQMSWLLLGSWLFSSNVSSVLLHPWLQQSTSISGCKLLLVNSSSGLQMFISFNMTPSAQVLSQHPQLGIFWMQNSLLDGQLSDEREGSESIFHWAEQASMYGTILHEQPGCHKRDVKDTCTQVLVIWELTWNVKMHIWTRLTTSQSSPWLEYRKTQGNALLFNALAYKPSQIIRRQGHAIPK